MEKSIETYRICYRVECFVEASDEDEAMKKYGGGEGEDAEYVEFMSIEKVNKDHTPFKGKI